MWPSETDDKAKKESFAIELLKGCDPWAAALAVFGTSDPGRCLSIADKWPKDNYVTQYQAEQLELHGKEAFLADKADTLKKIMSIHDTASHPDFKLKALRLYAEVRGFIIKPEDDTKQKSGIVAVPMSKVEEAL